MRIKESHKKQFVRTENDCDTIVKLIQGIQWFKVIKLTEILRHMKENLDMKKQEIGYLTSRYKKNFKCRERFRKRKAFLRKDSRPYAKILLDKIEAYGLLDSRASITILGKGARI